MKKLLAIEKDDSAKKPLHVLINEGLPAVSKKDEDLVIHAFRCGDVLFVSPEFYGALSSYHFAEEGSVP